MTETESILDQLAVRSGQLYSLPSVAMQVLQLTRNPHVDLRALQECIENDPAIASRILRVVNSSLYSPSHEVANLGQALAMLGIKPLKLLVLGFSLPSGLFLDVEAKMLLWYWKHALTKAVAGRELSQRLWRIPGDDAFIAGLLQDLGILLLFQQIGQPYARLLDRAVGERRDLWEMERQAMGFGHVELTAKLLRQWNLPAALCDGVAWQPSQGPNRTALTQILHLAELFARLFADGRTSALAELTGKAREYCHHIDQQLESLVQDVEDKVKELADIFSLELPDGLEYRDVLAEAHRQMARLANQAAEDLMRCRLPEQHEIDEDWVLGELDSLADALADVASKPLPAKAVCEAKAEPRVETPTTATATAPRPAATATARPATAAPNLLDRLTGVAAACRPTRRPLSLLLVKLSASEDSMSESETKGLLAVRQLLAGICARLDHPGMICLPHGDFGFANILPGADRTQAVELGSELVRTARHLPSISNDETEWLKLDVGIATIAQLPKNFPPRDLLDGAARCLYASHASGGGVVKSIEIY